MDTDRHRCLRRTALTGQTAVRSSWLWALSLFLTGLGAKLWLILRFGTPMPIWDQWDDVLAVYLPYCEGKLSLAGLLAAHSEHHIFFTRIYSLGWLLLNGQWDNQLQMVVNAIIHCATLAGLGWLMFRWVERRYWLLVWLPLALALVLPFGWENTLAGFQSQFYFLLVFSLLTLWLLGLSTPLSARWWCGAVAAVLALFTVASGFLAAAAVFALVVLRIIKCRVGQAFQPADSGDFPVARTPSPQGWKAPLTGRLESLPHKEVLTLILCAGVVLAGLLLKADVRVHHLLQAHSATEFLIALGNNLAWPWIVVPPFAVLNLLPLAVLAWRYLRRAGDRSRAEEMTLAIGFWAILQGAAAAYARGADGRPPGWRYMDSSSFMLIAICLSLAVLARSPKGNLTTDCTDYTDSLHPSNPRNPWSISAAALPRWVFRVFNELFRLRFRHSAFCLLSSVFWSLWAIACAIGLALLTSRAWQIDIPERHLFQRAQLQHVRAFMATGNPHVFDRIPRSQLTLFQGDPYGPQPLYEAQLEVDYLRNPIIRNILPACARQALVVRANPEATSGFVTNGVHLARKELPTELSWGSWSLRRPTANESRELSNAVAAPPSPPREERAGERRPVVSRPLNSSAPPPGPAQAASFESLPVQPGRFPYLEIPVAGNLGGTTNLSLELVELATGKRTPVDPARRPGGEWLNCYVKSPASEFKIVGREANGAGWFAFKAPREVGRLSFWAVEVLRAWPYCLAAGLALFVCNLLAMVASARQTR